MPLGTKRNKGHTQIIRKLPVRHKHRTGKGTIDTDRTVFIGFFDLRLPETGKLHQVKRSDFALFDNHVAEEFRCGITAVGAIEKSFALLGERTAHPRQKIVVRTS